MEATESNELHFHQPIIKEKREWAWSHDTIFAVFWSCITVFYFSCDVLQPSVWIVTILEKLTVAHLGRNYPKIYGAQGSFEVFQAVNVKTTVFTDVTQYVIVPFTSLRKKPTWFIFMADKSSTALAWTSHIIFTKTSESPSHSRLISLVHCSICSHLRPTSYFNFRFVIQTTALRTIAINIDGVRTTYLTSVKEKRRETKCNAKLHHLPA